MARDKSTHVNAALLLRQREITGGKTPRLCTPTTSADVKLRYWAESDLLRHCTSSYCNIQPPPRSTIATAFSPDGRLLASTHGDHTVKITCCRTGVCLRVLPDHLRTPWVVRFHPHDSRILASGSLDSHVRVWDVETGKCLYSYLFGRPIASIAFHANGNEIAVASGHRMYVWKYNEEGLTKPVPTVVLKTRRSLRAVHYHPTGAPLILTAEVDASGDPRRTPLPVDSTGLESRRERRARAERQAADAALAERLTAHADTALAALEVRLRQRWLEHGLPTHGLRRGTDTTAEAASGRQRGEQPSPVLETPEGTVTAGPVNRTEAAFQPNKVPNDPLEGPHTGVGRVTTGPGWARNESRPPALPLQPTAQPHTPQMDIPNPWAEGASRLESEQLTTTSRTRSEIRRFHAMLRSGGINPDSLPRRYPIDEALYAEIDRGRRPSSSQIPIPETRHTPRAHQRSSSLDDGAGHATRATVSPPAERPSTAGSFSAQRQWPTEEGERASTRGAGPNMQQRKPCVLDFLHLRRSSAPTPGENTRHLFNSFFRGQTRQSRETEAPEPPRTVLERISSSGGAADEAHAVGSSITDLPEAIEGRWSGSHLAPESAAHTEEADGQAAAGMSTGNVNAQCVAHPDFKRATDPAAGRSCELRRTSAGLPPSLVSMGWEFPAHNLIPDRPPATEARAQRPSSDRQMAGAADAAAPAQPGPHEQGQQATTADVRAAAANVIGSEQPCHVLVRLWTYNNAKPAALGPLRLAIQNTGLCSEMGVHFSPCGRMLAVCAATQPYVQSGGSEEEEGFPPYELRIYSLQADNFGQVIRSRRIKAAHCLTSIQFSPCSQHIMLAYGRRHISLLRSLIADNLSSILPVHTVLELYRVSDMSIARVLPSADDEVNTAGFHPFEGGGIAYGTKEGRLRVLTHSSYPLSKALTSVGGSHWTRLEDELLAAAHEAGQESSDDD